MRDFHLRFFSKRWPDGLVDLLADNSLMHVPQTRGAYVLGATDRSEFLYPWGRSPIFYIGRANNLNKRLSTHRKNIKRAIQDHEEFSWWPRYQYGAAYGTTVAWFSVRGLQTPESLEADLIADFYWTYGSIPVSNGSWPSGLKHPSHGSRDD